MPVSIYTSGKGGYRRFNYGGQIRKAATAVAEAFHGPRPAGLLVRHLNGRSADDRAVNLRYGTKAENTFDSIEHGTHHYAAATHCKRGHEFTPENTRMEGRGRRCLACKRLLR